MKKLLLIVYTVLCSSSLNGMDLTSLFFSGHPAVSVEGQRTVQEPSYQALPKEVKQEIITAAIASCKTVPDVIDTIKNFSTLHGVQCKELFNDLKSFTALMDIFAKKSPDASRKDIAEKLTMPIIKEYIQLNESFLKDVIKDPEEEKYYFAFDFFAYVLIKHPRNPKVKLNTAYTLLDKGVDPNFSWMVYPYKLRWTQRRFSLLSQACFEAFHADDANENKKSENNNKLAIFTLLLNRGAKPDAQVMEFATHLVNDFPTNLTGQLLLALLNQANA